LRNGKAFQTDSHPVVLGHYPIDVNIADSADDNSVTPLVLESADQLMLRKILRLPQGRTPILIVIDDSFPVNDPTNDPPEFQQSIKFFCGAIDRLTSKVITDISSLNIKCSAALKGLPVAPKPDGWNCAPAADTDCRTHSDKIASALETFTSVTGVPAPVNVVYVPFNVSQGPAAKELLRLLTLYKAVATHNAPDNPRQSDSQLIAAWQNLAEIDMQRADPTLTYVKGQKLETVSTDIVFVEALLAFAKNYSLVAHTPVFINASWTVIDPALTFAPPTGGLTAIFAASGNSCVWNSQTHLASCVGSNDQHFLMDSVYRPDVISVMNLDENGYGTCNATSVTLQYHAVGFSGAIDHDCGTSFASPRAAWLYALYESRRPPTLSLVGGAATTEPLAWLGEFESVLTQTAHCTTNPVMNFSLLYKFPYQQALTSDSVVYSQIAAKDVVVSVALLKVKGYSAQLQLTNGDTAGLHAKYTNGPVSKALTGSLTAAVDLKWNSDTTLTISIADETTLGGVLRKINKGTIASGSTSPQFFAASIGTDGALVKLNSKQ
jgi:hypothetical protein